MVGIALSACFTFAVLFYYFKIGDETGDKLSQLSFIMNFPFPKPFKNDFLSGTVIGDVVAKIWHKSNHVSDKR
ncbi:hypothetical protein ACJX0J_012327, partial [Zea mays]